MVTAPTRYNRLIAIVAAWAMLAGALNAQVAPGAVFPSLSLAVPDGVRTPETSGKVLIVDFWASWCAPCNASFPSLSRLNEKYADRGLAIIGVGVDDSPSAYSAFVARLKPPFATIHDSRHMLVSAVQVPTMPTSYVVDRTGKVRFIHEGYHGAQTEHALAREVEMLLSEKAMAP
jgi:thiol-disulfide isomerase/thioredoxin